MRLDRPHLVLGALLILGAWGALQYHDHEVRANAALQSSTDSLNRALQRTDSALAARSVQQAILQRENALLRLRASQVGLRADSLSRVASHRDTLFLSLLPDSLKVEFQGIVAVKDSAIAGLHGAIQDLVQALQRSDAGLSLRDTSLSECAAALKVAISQRDSWHSQAKPPLWKALFRDIPKYAAGAAVGAGLAVAGALALGFHR